MGLFDYMAPQQQTNMYGAMNSGTWGGALGGQSLNPQGNLQTWLGPGYGEVAASPLPKVNYDVNPWASSMQQVVPQTPSITNQVPVASPNPNPTTGGFANTVQPPSPVIGSTQPQPATQNAWGKQPVSQPKPQPQFNGKAPTSYGGA